MSFLHRLFAWKVSSPPSSFTPRRIRCGAKHTPFAYRKTPRITSFSRRFLMRRPPNRSNNSLLTIIVGCNHIIETRSNSGGRIAFKSHWIVNVTRHVLFYVVFQDIHEPLPPCIRVEHFIEVKEVSSFPRMIFHDSDLCDNSKDLSKLSFAKIAKF